MSDHRMGGVILSVLLVVLATPAARAADAVTEAKRRAASELMRDGKLAEAVALTQEVVKADPANYRDHLLLGRAYDKLNKSSEAVASYRRVLELLGPNDDRAVRAEVERRLKVLDVQTAKIQALEEEFFKKLDALEREAIAAKDTPAVRRVFRLKSGIYKASERRDRVGVEINAAESWQDGGIILQAGRTYRIRAVGVYQIHAGVDCTPDGTKAYPETAHGVAGMLVGKLDGTAVSQLGSSGRMTPDRTGRLYLLLNTTMPDKADSSGSVTVLVEQE
jgi:tetratricopeptide (TPR) repeat protein